MSSATTRIGQRYLALERLGRGGMAVVYRVRDTSQGHELALKQLTAHERETRALFEHEFQVLAQLAHPSVVEVHDFGVDVAGPYYTMELLESGDLSTRAPWPFQTACQLMVQVCSALSLLHSRRLVHRDVSPRNVRCTKHGTAKLIDFGAMVPMGPCKQVVGTPGFVAPEVVHQLALDARADLFSVGATLYYAITGCRPYVARSLAELSHAWQQEPVPVSERVAGIPAALDVLISSLLRVDPARRPSSAFEVMQRLAAIAGTPLTESDEISRAYLSTPLLIGREAQQRSFRQHLRRALHGYGSGLLIQGPSGLGHSRLLDTCVLEAKTSGALVLRLAGRAARPEAFASAHRLAEQLLEAMPDQAVTCAAEANALTTLFCEPELNPDSEQPASPRRLRSIDAIGHDSYAVQAALLAWLRRVSLTQPLVIAVDDSERLDERSLALLAAVVLGAKDAPLLVMCTAQQPIGKSAHWALGVLQSYCTGLTLSAFSAAETEALFASIFARAPNVSLLSDRIHKLATGNPRATLTLAQHAIERRLVRYSDGNWILPAMLDVGELPASVEEALRIQLAGLDELPRALAEAQAIAMDGPWTRADYGTLAKTTPAPRVDEALAALIRQGVIVEHAGAYTLSHPGIRAGLLEQLTAAQCLEHESALAEFCAHTGRPGLIEVYHLLRAEQFERGLERLGAVLAVAGNAPALQEQSGVDFESMAKIIERAHELSIAHNRKPRERHELARLLLELSIRTDNKLYFRHAPAWLTRLQLDSGLCEYGSTDPHASKSQRLAQAQQIAAARYEHTPEAERVYSVEQALKQLGYYVNASLVISQRTFDSKLAASLPELLEPFSAHSAAMYALWQNTLASLETTYNGQLEQARLRYLAIYQCLEQVSYQELPHLDAIRNAIAQAAARIEVTLGYSTAEHWLSIIEKDAFQRGTAQYLRRVLCIFDGDNEGAERCRRQAEVWALQANTRQMFEPPLLVELHLHVHVGDLTGVKHVADRMAQLASQWPGWRAHHFVAQGSFQRMRGDLPAAKQAFEQALALADPDQIDPPPMCRAWAVAAAEYITVLSELGELEQARAFGVRACERCDALGITEGYAHIRALALVEAKLGDYAMAAQRLDRLIAQRAQRRPSLLALDLEARARVAIAARDAVAAAHFARLATQGAAAIGGTFLLAKRGRLIDEARQAGLDLVLPLSDVEAAVAGSQPPAELGVPSDVLAAIERISDPSARAARVFDILAEAVGGEAGHLYYARGASLSRVATRDAAPEPALDEFTDVYLQDWLEYTAMTSVFTHASDGSVARFSSWLNAQGRVYRIALLLVKGGSACVGAVALCDKAGISLSPEYQALSAAISQRLCELGDAQLMSIR